MSIPFENNTSAVVKNMAKKNLRSDRKKNIFYIMAISIAVTIVVIVSLTVQNILQKNSEEISKLHQGIIYNINSELKDDIQSQKGVERVGLCTDVTTLDYMGKELFLFYYDNGMLPSKTSELIGNLPKEQYDIVLSENMLKQQGVPVKSDKEYL